MFEYRAIAYIGDLNAHGPFVIVYHSRDSKNGHNVTRAMAQTLSEAFQLEGKLGASFFFSRGQNKSFLEPYFDCPYKIIL